jgi:Activator of Hsp90 ATPase homolog 1-like protein
MDIANLLLDVHQHIEIKAAIGDVYEDLIRRLSDENATPDGTPLPMVLERWPGGRWFRDLGNGVGHLWGLVQVIKPPTLLEVHGPLFMSYPAAGHLQIRLAPISGGTELTLRHRVLGTIDEQHRQNVTAGWNALLQAVKKRSE